MGSKEQKQAPLNSQLANSWPSSDLSHRQISDVHPFIHQSINCIGSTAQLYFPQRLSARRRTRKGRLVLTVTLPSSTPARTCIFTKSIYRSSSCSNIKDKMSKATKKQWVDEDDDDEEAPVVTGIRDKVSFSENAKGQKVKTITKVRSKEIKTRIPKRILARRNLPRFGDAKSGEDNVTLVSKDIIAIEHPDDQLVEDAADDPTIKNTLASFIQKQQERSLMRDFEDDLEPGADDDKMGREEPTGKGGDGKYVPPAERMRLASGAPKQDLDQESTLRVSNLTKSVTEDDLRDLFEPFGRVLRVSLPRIERTENGQTWKEPRGFAYIAFVRKEDAEVALERLQGHGYDHLILKLEWAKPTRPDGGGGREGLSGGFVSGYGQKLAQDTKEKAVYASNLTGNSGSWMS